MTKFFELNGMKSRKAAEQANVCAAQVRALYYEAVAQGYEADERETAKYLSNVKDGLKKPEDMQRYLSVTEAFDSEMEYFHYLTRAYLTALPIIKYLEENDEEYYAKVSEDAKKLDGFPLKCLAEPEEQFEELMEKYKILKENTLPHKNKSDSSGGQCVVVAEVVEKHDAHPEYQSIVIRSLNEGQNNSLYSLPMKEVKDYDIGDRIVVMHNGTVNLSSPKGFQFVSDYWKAEKNKP